MKLSEPFETRLREADPETEIEAVLLVSVDESLSTASELTPRQRFRKQAEKCLHKIEAILDRTGGRLLSQPDALGSVRIRATPESILKLAQSDSVATVMENQRADIVQAV